MKIISRRVFVWLISFLVVIVAYKLYTIFNQTPIIELETTTTLSEDAVDVERTSNEQMGKVGGIEVGPIEKAQLFDRNPKTGEIEREFGYDRIANVDGSEWEIEKPYMYIYRPGLICKISAERGRVLIEEAVGRISPSDATLTNNVIVHIEPKENSNIAESFLYLDSIIYISEQSKITSTGPVRFVSDNARLNGRGMELVYNDELNRLEFLRIVQLESLRIRSEEVSLLTSQQKEPKDRNAVGTSAQKVSGSTASQSVSKTYQISPDLQTGINEQNNFYKCIFNKNVEIHTPDQIIAADKISMNNILNTSNDDTKTTVQQDNKAGEKESRPDEINKSSTNKEDVSSESAIEIIVTCDGGIVIVPTQYISEQQLSSQPESFYDDFVENKSADLKESGQLTTYVASTLDYFVQSGNTLALGPSELTFYIDDLMNAEMAVPAKITAKEKVSFFRSENKVVFEGDCLCSMIRENEGLEEKYTLTAPRITVNLYQQSPKSSNMPTTVDNIVADGGNVKLAILKKSQGELLGGIELKCNRFDYFAEEQYLVATGPGVIKADNSNARETGRNLNRFSLRRRCYALVENFETLTYFLRSNWFIAQAGTHQMFLGYVPVLDDGQYGPPTRAYTPIVESYLYKTPDGRFEIKNLKAQQGVMYESKDVQFEGSVMLYNAQDSIIFVRGNESTPCFLNGAPVDGIEYNLITGEGKAKVVAPGMFLLSR